MLARREVIADQAASQVEQNGKAPPPHESGSSQEKHAHVHRSWEGDDGLTSEDDVVRIVRERAQAEENQRGDRDDEGKTSAETR
jgi:hypothetical protein